MKPPDTGPLYADAVLYDLQHKDYLIDLPFYREMFEMTGSPVLELMAGTGRLSIPLAKAGADVTALDYSREMLQRAEEKAKIEDCKVHFVQGDCRDFKLNRKFKLIFIPFNSMSHIHDKDAISNFLMNVRYHLHEQGRFVIDVFVPDFRILLRSDNQRYPVADIDDTDHGRIKITENNQYDQRTQINHIKWYYEIDGLEDSRVVENNMRMFFPEELKMLMECHGFQLIERYGDYDLSPFTKDSGRQICVCTKK